MPLLASSVFAGVLLRHDAGMEIDWASVETERKSLAADLAGLSAEQWAAPSLCSGWSVHQALAHMVSVALVSPTRFAYRMAQQGNDFDAVVALGVVEETAGDPAVTLQTFRDLAANRTQAAGPPGAVYGETLVHAEDIRRPLGIVHAYPVEAMVSILEFYAQVPSGSGLSRAEGVLLEATDADWSWGSGPVVRGRLSALMLAITGRELAFPELSGDGVPLLRARA